MPETVVNSFASNGECGLKQPPFRSNQTDGTNSFASNGECGLKQRARPQGSPHTEIHSPAMANVD